MSERMIGILGGMGPEATVDFFREIIRLTPADKDQDHLPIIVYSDPRIPERNQAILYGGEDPTPYLVKGARALQQAGADVLAMPCNAAHFFLNQIRQAVTIPILDMIEETYIHASAYIDAGRAAGLLATQGTISSGVYRETFLQHDVEILVPDPQNQDRLQEAIFLIKKGVYDPSLQDVFEEIGSTLIRRGAQVVILGCTEIPLGFRADHVDYPVINATRALAQAAVDWALGRTS